MLKETVVAQYPTEPHPRQYQRATPYRSHHQVPGGLKVTQRRNRNSAAKTSTCMPRPRITAPGRICACLDARMTKVYLGFLKLGFSMFSTPQPRACRASHSDNEAALGLH